MTGGDLFELVPVKPYSREDLNWNDENSRVVYEYEHPAERKVALTTVTAVSYTHLAIARRFLAIYTLLFFAESVMFSAALTNLSTSSGA